MKDLIKSILQVMLIIIIVGLVIFIIGLPIFLLNEGYVSGVVAAVMEFFITSILIGFLIWSADL